MGKTIEEATREWVREFDAIPQNILFKLARDGDIIIEITPRSADEDYDEDRAFLPMWGWMWSFHEPRDDSWLEEKGNLQTMADCGFRIYKQEDCGYIFGIDGAGYDFFEAHWVPLYKARGLRWHCS